MAGLDFDNVVVSVDGRTVNTIAGAAPVFAVEATWDGIENKPQTFPPAPHDHDGVYLPIHGTADLSGGVTPIQLTNEDLNDLIPSSTTWYYAAGGSSVTNRPPNAGTAFGLMVMKNASGNRFQIYINSSAGAIYSRNFYSNAWTAWTQWPVNFATAGYRNSIYRGINLGNAVTAEQYAAISAGTFENMFVGDYWAINGVIWRIAAFDYWLGTGASSVRCNTHHVVIVPDTALASDVKMNSNATTEGAYVGSDFYTGNNDNTGKATAIAAIESAFGSDHILTHVEYLANAMNDGYESARSWYDSTAELMSEMMLFGSKIYSLPIVNSNASLTNDIEKGQLPLFNLDHTKINITQGYWLRDAWATGRFTYVGNNGHVGVSNANTGNKIRPAFGIIG